MGEREPDLPVPNRNYRDTVFRMLFQEKTELLSLFNAIHGTSYKESEELEITTLENAVYMSMKNDVSCVLDMQLDLYEQQSTVNNNMPLRDLFYISKLYETMTRDQDLYGRKRIILPVPKFIVFYNGSEPQPERREFRLSDSFAREIEPATMELVVVQLNIHSGYNTELVQKCQTLFQYIQYTERIRGYSKDMPLEEAVEIAVNECIEEGILSDFLRQNRSEVVPMSIFEYDEKKHMQTVRREGYEDGMEQGMEKTNYQIICNMFRNDLAPELISKYTDQPLDYVYEIEKKMLAEVREDARY